MYLSLRDTDVLSVPGMKVYVTMINLSAAAGQALHVVLPGGQSITTTLLPVSIDSTPSPSDLLCAYCLLHLLNTYRQSSSLYRTYHIYKWTSRSRHELSPHVRSGSTVVPAMQATTRVVPTSTLPAVNTDIDLNPDNALGCHRPAECIYGLERRERVMIFTHRHA